MGTLPDCNILLNNPHNDGAITTLAFLMSSLEIPSKPGDLPLCNCFTLDSTSVILMSIFKLSSGEFYYYKHCSYHHAMTCTPQYSP